MKKLLSILFALLMLCACGTEDVPNDTPEITEKPIEEKEEKPTAEPEKEPAEENAVFTIGGKDYEVDVPEKTRLTDNGNGIYQIDTPSLAEAPAVIDLSVLSGCEEIKELYVYTHAEAKSIVVPGMPNLKSLYIYGMNAEILDISGAEGIEVIHINLPSQELKIGAGPKTLLVDYGFDLSKLAGAKNIKSLTVYGDNDLSLIADIGEVEEVYIIGEETNIGELENLKSLKRLSVYSMGLDFSPIENLTVKTLIIADGSTYAFTESFTYSETLAELQIDDEILEDASFLEKMPNLKKLLLTVDPSQDESLVLWNEAPIEKEMISALKTNIPKEQLEALVDRGGEIYLFPDPWRNN